MLRNKQQQQQQQQHKRPLLIHEDNRTLGEHTKYTTSSQSLDTNNQAPNHHHHHHRNNNNNNTHSATKRRLRIFGALGGGGGVGGAAASSYAKQPPTPPPPQTIHMISSSSSSSPTTASQSSRPYNKYDTRPIYTEPSHDSKDDWASYPTAANTTTNTPAALATPLAPKIPTLPSNHKDSGTKKKSLLLRTQVDPPTRQDEEAARRRQQQQAAVAAVVATQRRSQSIHRPKSQTKSRNRTPPRRVQQQQQRLSTHDFDTHHYHDDDDDGAIQPSTTTKPSHQTTPVQPPSKVSVPLRDKRGDIVEEKKTDETERLLQVANVVLRQETVSSQPQQPPTTTTLSQDLGLPPSGSSSCSSSTRNNTTTTTTPAKPQPPPTEDPIRAMLSRPFGRETLPISVGRNFVVQVSSAEWDADEDRWKYRILVQQRHDATQKKNNNDKVRGSFTTAYTWRSLSDFGWLEQALRWEYHGALLVPLLNMAVGMASVSPATAVPVEAECLRHWLTDLLNGIRGQGEWLYLESCSSRNEASILQSEAMEMFLYRTGALTQEQLLTFTLFPGAGHPNKEESTLVQRLTKTFENLAPLAELCVGPMPQNHEQQEQEQHYAYQSSQSKKRQPMRIMCASGALATTPSLDMNDSFGAENSRQLTGYQEHPILLMHLLLRNYRETALSAFEKLSTLRPAEEALGVAWKRMAIALTYLFAYEKDVESAKLGDLKVKRENMPFRKVQKSHVDDGLRVLSRHKVERSEPALRSIRDFLSALLADLSAVGPSVEAFREAQKYEQEIEKRIGGEGASTMDGSTYDETTAASRGASRATSGAASSYSRRRWIPTAQSFLSIQRTNTNESILFQERFQRNEVALQDAMVSLMQHLPVRMARMAWRHWQSEISQVAELHKAAAVLREKVSITKEESISRMIKRHWEEEKQDKMAEILLIQRMLQIGHKEYSIEEPPEITRKREHALNIAKERLGKWDIRLGLAVMEAIGIEDPNVRVEETTRDLRLVRKYAIGLRECLNRCVEAVGGVRAALLASEGPARDLREARQKFFKVLTQLFSGKVIKEDTKRPPWNVLPNTLQHKVGIAPTRDPFHWSAVFAPEQQASRNRLTQNSVGGLARECMEAKDKSTAWLLGCMSELLNDYQHRVQQIESYVYMECVGIQLERHFSEKRAAALAAFEKKTDITTAINVAHKKKLHKLVEELQRKLDEIGNEVTQTTVREAKELHLESKQLKSDIHDLAVRRLVRARETSTERAVALISLWAKEEETSAASELKAMGEAIAALEKAVGEEDLDAIVRGEERKES